MKHICEPIGFNTGAKMIKVDVVPVSDNFRGLPYGFWLARWNNYLLSQDPDHYDGGEIFFMRGILDYKKPTDDVDSPRFQEPGAFLDMTNKRGYKIYEDTAVFVPVFTSQYDIGSVLEGKRKQTEEQVRSFINKDLDRGSEIWATIQTDNSSVPYQITNDLRNFRVESQIFRLVIPRDSKLNTKQYMEHKPGVHDAIVGGYCLIIRSLPRGSYRISFGAKGRGDFYTNAIYDIKVGGERRVTVQDVSKQKRR